MVRFGLLTTGGEVIATTMAFDKVDAAKNFADRKRLKLIDLLMIFNVKKLN